MWGGSERRKYKRIKTPFVIRFRELPEGAEGAPEGQEWDKATAKNLSAGGVLFNFGRKLEVENVLEMQIDLSGADDPVECTGRVIRVEEQGNICLIAVVFTDLGEDDKKALERAVGETI